MTQQGSMDDKIGKRIFKIYDPLFSQSVTVFINCEEDDFMKWQKRLNVVNADGLDPNLIAFTTYVSADGEPSRYVIWLTHFDWTLDDQESLVHECIHAVIRIWKANNIPVSIDNQEFLAHSAGKLYSMIGAKLFHKKLKGKAYNKTKLLNNSPPSLV